MNELIKLDERQVRQDNANENTPDSPLMPEAVKKLVL